MAVHSPCYAGEDLWCTVLKDPQDCSGSGECLNTQTPANSMLAVREKQAQHTRTNHRPTIALEHNSHVVLCPRADVDQDAGSAGGAEAEHQLLFSQVGSAEEADSCPALGFSQCKIGSLWEEVITNQGPCLKVPTHVYDTQVRESHSNGGGQWQTFVDEK